MGVAWNLENFINVDFRWLTAPFMLWLFSTVFFFNTVLITERRNAPLWKSSVLVLLHMCDEHGASSSMNDIKSNAKNAKKRLVYSDNSWRFVDARSLKVQS
jgi:hypothetical protein